MASGNHLPAVIPPEPVQLPGFEDYGYLKREVLALTGIDLNGYKEKQMRRRINTLILRSGLDTYEGFIALLKRSPAQLAYFVDYITINVTEFFRTPEHWWYFTDTMIPEIVKRSGGHPKIWSAACATGEEVYSLAMSFAEYMPLEDIRILATDLDRKVLSEAEKGIYTEKAVSTVPQLMREQYFTFNGAGYEVIEPLRRCVTFRRLNLLEDEYPSGCDLIVCRNVLIYFTEESKRHVFAGCREALKPEGILFTGNTEQLIAAKQLGFAKEKPFLYRKADGSSTRGDYRIGI